MFDLNIFYYQTKSLLLTMKWVIKHRDFENVLVLNKSNFQAIEVVGRVSGTQLQVDKNLYKIIYAL